MANDNDSNDVPSEQDEEQRRLEEMENLLMQQEQAAAEEEEQEVQAAEHPEDDVVMPLPPLASKFQISYTRTSFLAAVAVVVYAVRTRQQWYLACVFLGSSKWAYIILGNALVATCVSIFWLFVRLFLQGGLRPAEAEGLGEFFRWNLTETCLALTMFRSEMNVKTGVLFLLLVLAKCLHWIAEMRRGHFQMTQEAVSGDQWPRISGQFVMQCAFLFTLLVLDLHSVASCAHHVVKEGPSVSLFFGFEAAILLTSAMSNLLLAGLHLTDGLIHWAHEVHHEQSGLAHSVLHAWKDHKATFTFAVEVQAHAAKFLFYILFFGIVLTYYGMPLNLFREVYLSFQNLRQRLVAFAKYRKLMANMVRFDSVTQEELEEAGPTCIICRDVMTPNDCKKLPGCGHIFHRSCLREWLIHQQTCPTCRSDIAATSLRVAASEARANNNNEAEQQQQQEGGGDEAQQEAAAEANPTEETIVAPPTDKQEKETVKVDLKEKAAVTLKRPTPVSIPPPLVDKADDAVFPCLYRVLEKDGASVWVQIDDDDDDEWTALRVVPCGTLVLVTALHYSSSSGLLLKIPDGYMEEGNLERLSIVLPKKPMAVAAAKPIASNQ